MKYYGNREAGLSLKHYRTKGSRNGYSKNPKYRPIGQRATGRIVNGRYVYDQGAQNNWQQQAAANRNMYETAGRIRSGASKSGNMSMDGFDFNVSNRGKTITDYSTAKAHQNAVNQANAEARARNAIANRGSSKKANRYDPNGNATSAMRMNPEGYKPYHNGMAHPAYSEVGSADMRIAEKIARQKAMRSKTREDVAREELGEYKRLKKRNRRQNPNASIYAKSYGDTMQSVNAKVNSNFGRRAYSNNIEAGGAMRNDPRYSSKSVYLNKVGDKTVDKQTLAKAIGESKHENLSKGMQRINKLDAARGSMNRSIRKAKQEVANTASKAYDTASKYASAAANKAKSAASSASKAASNAVASGKKTVDDILNKFKKKKK